jgi:hypothetical protein
MKREDSHKGTIRHGAWRKAQSEKHMEHGVKLSVFSVTSVAKNPLSLGVTSRIFAAKK